MKYLPKDFFVHGLVILRIFEAGCYMEHNGLCTDQVMSDTVKCAPFVQVYGKMLVLDKFFHCHSLTILLTTSPTPNIHAHIVELVKIV
mgnify:CR=1 FL=1